MMRMAVQHKSGTVWINHFRQPRRTKEWKNFGGLPVDGGGDGGVVQDHDAPSRAPLLPPSLQFDGLLHPTPPTPLYPPPSPPRPRTPAKTPDAPLSPRQSH